jgi:mono/diheme cytochrome c family protein
MKYLKLAVWALFAVIGVTACINSPQKKSFVIADSKSYGASIFRQNCAICHGPEGHGRTLDNGTKVPSLREGELKMLTPAAIANQIANGGNGMPPFRNTLTQREQQIMTDFVYHDLRGN